MILKKKIDFFSSWFWKNLDVQPSDHTAGSWCPFPPETSFLSGHSLPHHLVSHSKHGSQQISCCTTTKPCTGTLHAGAWRYCGAGSQFSTQGPKRNQFSMDRDRSGCWVTAEVRDTQPKHRPAGINNAACLSCWPLASTALNDKLSEKQVCHQGREGVFIAGAQKQLMELLGCGHVGVAHN